MSRPREIKPPDDAALKLGDILEEFDERLGARPEPEILTLTEKMGFVSQRERFNKRLAIADTSNYKVIGLSDIAFNPYLLWANAIAQNTGWEEAIISPLYPTFRVRKGYSARFANYLLCSGYLRSHYGSISYGSVPRKRRATVRDFLDLPIPRQPSLAEQERIEKLLDEADRLRKLRAQGSQRTTALIPALFHEMFGDPAANTRNWNRETFADLLDRIDSGWSPTCHDRPAQPDEWGVLKLGAVTTCQYLDTETKALPKDFAPRPELEVKVGDLLFTRKNTYELVAACAFVFETRPKLTLSDLLFRFRLKPSVEINPLFLWGLLTFPNKRKQV